MKERTRAAKARMTARAAAAVAIMFAVCLAALFVVSHGESASAHEQTGAKLRLESSSFADGSAIPSRFTCDGTDESPDLHWASPPAGTRSLAIVMNDPDAPIEFTHWLAYNIVPGVHGLPAGASTHGGMPQGSGEGTNSFGRFGYGGPCPPPGKPHHYVFRLYALNVRLDLPTGAGRRQLESAMNSHLLAQGQIVGIYRRAGQ